MGPEIYTPAEVCNMVGQGRRLLLAGDESLLREIPAGNWIGGTIPYFMTRAGGVTTSELIHVTELPDYVTEIELKRYTADDISQVYTDAPENGFSIIIIPAQSSTHFSFALNAPNYENFAMRPLIGWISGTYLDERGKKTPKIFDGTNAEMIEDGAIVMHARLPHNKVADIGIINMFEQGDGDTITFPESGFCTKEAFINGKPVDFANYIQQKQLDKRLPLVANYFGAMLNTTFKATLGPDGEVQFYNSVFSFLEYKHAKPIQNYTAQFTRNVSMGLGIQAVFACNCILNYIHSDLERKHIDCVPGPATFGEIAYQTLNQTLVYLRIIDLYNRY